MPSPATLPSRMSDTPPRSFPRPSNTDENICERFGGAAAPRFGALERLAGVEEARVRDGGEAAHLLEPLFLVVAMS